MAKMTIKQCEDAALQLLNQYSIAGALVPLSYNDQSDDKQRMINLINDAQMQIATTVKPILEYVEFEVPEQKGIEPITELAFDMPEYFINAKSITFTPLHGHKRLTTDANVYKWIGDTTLLLPSRPAGTYRVDYSRYPYRYDMYTDEETELDNTPDTHEIIPYFVAAMIAQYDNSKAYFNLYNVWETRLSRLGYKPAHAVYTDVHDVYDFYRRSY